MPANAYFPGLDAIRFLAALSVVAFHLGYLTQAADYREIWPITWMGWIGVQIFFVISGFVIAKSAKGSTPLQFIKSRALRVYPAVWCCATIAFAVQGIGLLEPYIHSMLLLPKRPWIDDVYWTLAVEISFYLMILALLCLNRFSLVSRAAFVVTIFNAICLAAATMSNEWAITISRMNLLLANHGCFFALGIWVWYSTKRILRVYQMLGILLATFVGIGEICLYGARFQPTPNHLWMIAPILIWLAALVAIFVFAHVEIAPSNLLRRLGLMTYPLYLVHNVSGRALEARLIEIGANKWLALGVSVAAVIALSWIICIAWEPLVRVVLTGGTPRRTVSAS